MKLGIIGCGVISRIYVRDLQRLYSDLVSIEAVANASMDKAKKLAEEFQIPVVCSVDELLERKDIELVINLTPPKVHTEINRKVLNAGKHVFCEKPFALSVEEAEENFYPCGVQGTLCRKRSGYISWQCDDNLQEAAAGWVDWETAVCHSQYDDFRSGNVAPFAGAVLFRRRRTDL